MDNNGHSKDEQTEYTYTVAYTKMVNACNKDEFIEASTLFQSISDYKDASEQINKCKAIIEKLIEKEEKTKKFVKKYTLITSSIVVFCIATLIAVNYFVILPQKYENAMNLYNNKQYGEAGVALAKLGNYKESKKHLKNALEYVRNSTPQARVFSCALTTSFINSDGTVIAVGNNMFGQCDVSDWEDIIAVSSNTYHTVGLK